MLATFLSMAMLLPKRKHSSRIATIRQVSQAEKNSADSWGEQEANQ